uniref:Uncharacterized protein n=1 Tax=Anguilla anguilla TaxID=7936 RepID=A0A0E9V3G2_ANGAN
MYLNPLGLWQYYSLV